MWIIIVLILLVLTVLVYASADIRSGFYVKTVSRLDTAEKLLALTFDDGPHPEVTPKVLAILKKYGIRSVFFCTGEHITAHKSLAQRIVEGGHLIGNHSYNHRNGFPLLSVRKMREEINRCKDLIATFNLPDTPLWFRPPFGVTNPRLKKALKGSGYRVMGWSLRSLDTTIRRPEKVVERVVKRIKPGKIVLFHDSHENTPLILERVINFALENGYKFVRADEKDFFIFNILAESFGKGADRV
ncbi:MAG: polysaccharide deacetylase family protein [Dysgonamonadaceae bacterium]|jgi:peptidoglycan/xylan/chitin deacetylase (PgdA/CDA1 family)|nr:polysaccharide deacetylase family protein [Dysgonamonadaceae bacterium]